LKTNKLARFSEATLTYNSFFGMSDMQFCKGQL